MNKFYRTLLTNHHIPPVNQTEVGHVLWPDGVERNTIAVECQGVSSYHTKGSAAYPYSPDKECGHLETGMMFACDGKVVSVGGVPIFDLLPSPVQTPLRIADHLCVYPAQLWLPNQGMYGIRRRVPAQRGYEATRDVLLEELSIFVELLPTGTTNRVIDAIDTTMAHVTQRVTGMLLAYRTTESVEAALAAVTHKLLPSIPGVNPEHAGLALAYSDLLLAQSPSLGIEFAFGLRQLVSTSGEVLPVFPEVEKW